MKQPFDQSDVATLIQADWHEENGHLDVAETLRDSVGDSTFFNWNYERILDTDHVGNVGGVGAGVVGGVGVGADDISVGCGHGACFNDIVGAVDDIGGSYPDICVGGDDENPS